jgi:hypothetical protein
MSLVWRAIVAWLYLQGGAAPGAEIILPKGFVVPVRMDRQLDSSHAQVGMTVDLRVSHDLRWQGCLVFRCDAPVSAIVSEVHGPGIVGRPSLIVLDIQSTAAADGTVIALSGTIRAEGEDRTMESIGAAAGVCCLGVFIPGGRQAIGKGVGTLALTTTEVRVQCIETSD